MKQTRVIDVPEDLALVFHLLMVTSHTLAIAASQQPRQLRGRKPKVMLEECINSVLSEFSQKSAQEQERLINKTMETVARNIAAIHEAGGFNDSP